VCSPAASQGGGTSVPPVASRCGSAAHLFLSAVTPRAPESAAHLFPDPRARERRRPRHICSAGGFPGRVAYLFLRVGTPQRGYKLGGASVPRPAPQGGGISVPPAASRRGEATHLFLPAS